MQASISQNQNMGLISAKDDGQNCVFKINGGHLTRMVLHQSVPAPSRELKVLELQTKSNRQRTRSPTLALFFTVFRKLLISRPF